MIRTHRLVLCIAALVLAAPAFAGGGPFIEITIQGFTDSAEPNTFVTATAVFDTSAAPIGTNIFEGVAASVNINANTGNTFFRVAPAGSILSTGEGTLALPTLTIIPSPFRYIVTFGNPGVTLDIFDPNAGFAPGVASLPADPSVWGQTTLVTLQASIGGASFNEFWPGISGFTGTLKMQARVVSPPAPEPQGCNVADLAEPFGVHDFSDVVAYLTAFGAGCP